MNSYNTKKGSFDPEIYYFTKTDNDYDNKRLILMVGPSYLYPYIIPPSSFTLSDNIVYLNCSGDFNCENFLLFLNSPLGKYIDGITRPSNNNNGLLELLSNLKPLPTKKRLNLEEIYSNFNLNEKERNYINKEKTKPTTLQPSNPPIKIQHRKHRLLCILNQNLKG